MKVLNILLMSCFGGILIDIGACITGIKYSQSMEFGIPIIDALMREMNHTGFMSNRGR